MAFLSFGEKRLVCCGWFKTLSINKQSIHMHARYKRYSLRLIFTRLFDFSFFESNTGSIFDSMNHMTLASDTDVIVIRPDKSRRRAKGASRRRSFANCMCEVSVLHEFTSDS